MKSRMSWKMGHVRLKTRSLGQILEKTCIRSGGHICSPIIMKPGLNVCLEKSLMTLKMGYVGSKAGSLGQILEKPCVHSGDLILVQLLMKLGQNVCFDDF